MHESEWLPKVLLKPDLIHICTVLSLSEDGFRTASLPQRPVANIRNVIMSALKMGIGRKKRRNTAIPLDVFYEEIAADAVRGRSDLMTDDFESLMFSMILDDSLRPHQRLALVYERNREFYLEHYSTIVHNALSKVDWFQEVFQVDESMLLKQMINETIYPTEDQYEQFIEEAGLTTSFDQIKGILDTKMNNRSKITYVKTLSGTDLFLGQLALLPTFEELEPVVFSAYAELQIAQKEITVKELSKHANELEEIQRLWTELLPRSNKVVIVTETEDPRMSYLFPGMMVPKAYLYDQQYMNTKDMKQKEWMIDRRCFANTKEWMDMRMYMTNHDITFEEFYDDMELIRQYVRIFQGSETEDVLC